MSCDCTPTPNRNFYLNRQTFAQSIFIRHLTGSITWTLSASLLTWMQWWTGNTSGHRCNRAHLQSDETVFWLVIMCSHHELTERRSDGDTRFDKNWTEFGVKAIQSVCSHYNRTHRPDSIRQSDLSADQLAWFFLKVCLQLLLCVSAVLSEER